MASSSSSALDIDDDFDWEAAVKEIDSACEVATAPTSNQTNPGRPIMPAFCPKPRQSTLDRFVNSLTKRKMEKDRGGGSCIYKPPVSNREGFDNPGAVGGESSVSIDLEAAKTWIYPVNIPLRDYQFSIAKSSLFSNTLVALPTGLGKTLIAAVVMYNYFRWFPEGKIVFAAPSRPLVMQQIEACHNIVGIPQEWAIEMTGQMSPQKRAGFWTTKRVFFLTPQVLDKDIQSDILALVSAGLYAVYITLIRKMLPDEKKGEGQARICLVKQLVCLVIDEAHRAVGNYAYCVAVRELMAVPVQLRILALTATPGSKQQKVQDVIDNLCISTLEYRNEIHGDVSPYVHDRKLELIEVAMGKDATVIYNLLLEAIQPFVTRLRAIKVLYNRDLATLSPCELLNSRAKFRQEPPHDLPDSKYREVENWFLILIPLCEMRKLLSSYGIKPAYEKLSEKLQEGFFAWHMNKNETIANVKLLMQQSLSHGAPNPKLVKMIEILVDHFKAKGLNGSRVIIFSNYRESVKDIMNSLSSIEDLVKATEFIGQSSGKASKGQTQKVQQAVLQKFRTGGYNVIVATSIAEEGLDIMEVDLVICFDANISPLRMIQRMGRTGRKHDGRVVILACEGSEIKGYQKKQAISKSIRKHMHNGGATSFKFNSSPRMVPHICKPEVKFVELTIEQFIPRGKKPKDDTIDRSPFLSKLLNEEKEMIARYFYPSKEDIWKPSLIAFPTSQTFPSRVHAVSHSFRTTTMLIDGMQRLQGLTFSAAKETCSLNEVDPSIQPLEDVTTLLENNEQDSSYVYHGINNIPKAISKENYSEVVPLRETQETKNAPQKPDHPIPIRKPSSHCFLFGGSFVTVNSSGSVLIACAPVLPHKNSAVSKINAVANKESLISTRDDACSLKGSVVQYVQLEDAGVEVSAELKFLEPQGPLTPRLPECDIEMKNGTEHYELKTPISKDKYILPGVKAAESPINTDNLFAVTLAREVNTGNAFAGILAPDSSATNVNDMELSPRLTYLIEEGVVPESPMVKIEQSSKAENMVCESIKPGGKKYEVQAKCYSTKVQVKNDLMGVRECSRMLVDMTEDNEKYESQDKWCSANLNSKKDVVDIVECSAMIINSSRKIESHATCHVSPNITKVLNNLHESRTLDEDVRTPIGNTFGNISSESWQLSSGEAPKSSLPPPKYKRLRKFGDAAKLSCQILEEKYGFSPANARGLVIRGESIRVDQGKGKKEGERKCNARVFIEEEAEVSQDVEVSEDEDYNNEDAYDDSFIDDRINPTEASTETEKDGDMMAIYRRSLLTQSPLVCPANYLGQSHDSLSRTAESGTCSSEKKYNPLLTPRNGSQSVTRWSNGGDSVTCQVGPERVSLAGEAIDSPKECSAKLERKRKLSFQNANFQIKRLSESEHPGKVSLHHQPVTYGLDLDDDDDFYQGLDLDAVEAQATELLRYKSVLSVKQMQGDLPNYPSDLKEDPNMDFQCSPTFDLGI